MSSVKIYSIIDKRLGLYVAKRLTNCLRVIRNAWHFYHALRFVFKVVCGGFGIVLLTP